MQWFIRTTEELRERIEQIYRLESALARLDTLAANLDNIYEQLEKDLRPAKVQHEMRLRALEPLLEQIEDQERFKTELLKWLDDSTAEIKRLRQEFSGLKKLSAAKTEKLIEQHATNSKAFRVELDALKEKLAASTAEKMSSELAALRVDFELLKEELSAPKDDPSVEKIVELQSEIDGLKELMSAPKDDPSVEKIAAIQSDVAAIQSELNGLKEELSAPKDDPSAEKIVELQSEIDGLKELMSAPKDDPSAEKIIELQSEIDGLKELMSAPKDDPSAEKIIELQSEIDGLKEKLAEPKVDHTLEEINKIYIEFQSSLSAKDEEIKQLWQLFSERIEAKDKELSKLRDEAASLTEQLEDRGNAIGELIRQVGHLWKKIEGLEEKLDVKREPEPKTRKNAIDIALASTIENEPKILQFEIESSGLIYLTGTPEEITTKLKAAMNVEEMQTFLEGSKAANKVIFLRSLDRHVRNLQKLTYKLNFDEYDEEQVSEEVTKKFFEIFKLTLLESVASTSYRGLSRQPEFYREFLGHFNRYLQRCGIYTRRVLPNSRLTEQDQIDMKINWRETINAANVDLITEVERLPYYIDYLSADGSTKHLFFEGKLIAYGAKNNA